MALEIIRKWGFSIRLTGVLAFFQWWEFIDIGWFWVFSPLWMPFVVIFVLFPRGE